MINPLRNTCSAMRPLSSHVCTIYAKLLYTYNLSLFVLVVYSAERYTFASCNMRVYIGSFNIVQDR